MTKGPHLSERSRSDLRSRLFRLFRCAIDAGGLFAPVNRLGEIIECERPACFLRHDVHGLELDALVQFAAEEAEMGVFGSYFFMTPDHPSTISHYNFKRQAAAMRNIRLMGHELGLHVDPYFLVHYYGAPLRSILVEALERCRDEEVLVVSGNIHGHTCHTGPDVSGYGTSFDFFEELARQGDFPTLSGVPPEYADVLRQNRMALSDIGFDYWADRPLWSRRFGYVDATAVTDNWLTKKGQFFFSTHEDALAHYKTADYQPPGGRNNPAARDYLPYAPPPDAHTRAVLSNASWAPFESEECWRLFQAVARVPSTLLIHPQHYC